MTANFELEHDLQTAQLKQANIMKIARLRKGYSQKQMAHMLGTTQATYSRTESGITKPDETILQHIAEILEVPVKDLFEQESPTAPQYKADQAATALNAKDIPAMLRELKKLLDDDIITEDQFDEKRKELLARL